MKNHLTLAAMIVLFSVSCAAVAQSSDASNQDAPPPPPPAAMNRPVTQNADYDVPAFSRMSIGGGVSLLGIGMQVSTNLNEHLNIRATGNVLKYNTSFTVSGVPAAADLNLGSAGALLDYYPFHVGWRLSAGVLYINQNEMDASANIPGGDSFTLNGQTYYSANPNTATGATSLTGSGKLSLNQMKPGVIVTTGWGNHVRRNGHWTVPFEIGVAFVGTPKVTMGLNGWACADAAQTACANVGDSSNPLAVQFQSDLNGQVGKWNSDISALRSYPIVTTGIAYSFNIRRY